MKRQATRGRLHVTLRDDGRVLIVCGVDTTLLLSRDEAQSLAAVLLPAVLAPVPTPVPRSRR